MRYFLRLFDSPGFWVAPFSTLLRALHLSVLVALKRSTVILIRFGSQPVRFNYIHGKRYGGGRGLFLLRENIEDLMTYGDRFMKRGDVVIDGGANQGVFTTSFGCYVGPEGRVIGIEPMAYAVERVRANACLNGIEGWVDVVQAGLSDSAGMATLDLTRGVGAASITNDYSGQETIEIETVTIDMLVNKHGLDRVDFIKLDIEGAELKALHGAAKTLEQFHPTLCLEISIGSGSDTEEAAHYHLLELGYQPFVFHGAQLQLLEGLDPPHVNVFYVWTSN